MTRNGGSLALGAKWLVERLHEVIEVVTKQRDMNISETKCDVWFGSVLQVKWNEGGTYLECISSMEGKPTTPVKVLIPANHNCKGWKGLAWGLTSWIKEQQRKVQRRLWETSRMGKGLLEEAFRLRRAGKYFYLKG